MALRDKLLAPKTSTEPILILDNEPVHARTIDAMDIADAQATIPEGDARTTQEMLKFAARLAIYGACDAKGEKLFTLDDLDAVCRMPHDMLMKLVNGIKSHNGMDDTAKNSSTPSTEGS